MHRRGSDFSGACAVRALTGCVLALAACAARAQTRDSATAPSYSAAGLVNAATGLAGSLAPNAIASLYGTNLAWTTHAVTAADLVNGALPTSLAGVTVYVDNLVTGLFFVSPGQINFLIPYEARGTTATIFVLRQGVIGPVLTIPMAPVSPGFFQWNGNFAVAEHADGSLISPDAPAKAGEIVVLYAAGLGLTIPDLSPGSIVSTATPILAAAQLQVLINGAACASCRVYYAGVTPGFAGLYQINVRLPDDLPSNPAVQMAIGAASSPAGVQLYTQ